ncbi:glutathione S-transferase C-terminal domain-containing protein [Profundibacter sp.]|uniref:glutathione S-transferase C-terminal domain-containing protein n=1 Tax=Profundibacter sp. TaxID=3101071 RepID=UPI003D0A791C
MASEIDQLSPWLYHNLNNGVYKAGFASSQAAYDEAVANVFSTLDQLEERLLDGRSFLLGADLTEADIRLFVTLIRFDAAYHDLFKTNLRRIADYPILQSYLKRVLNFPGIAKTVNLEHIKAGYYSIKALNPSGIIIPNGPNDIEQLVKDAQQQGVYSSNTLGNHSAISGNAITMPKPNSCNSTNGTIPA